MLGLNEREALCLLLGIVGVGTQVAGFFIAGSADPALVTAFSTFILVALGFRLDRVGK